MNKRKVFTTFITVIVLLVFVVGMATIVSAEAVSDASIAANDEFIETLLSNPLTWIIGALLVAVFTVVQLIGAAITGIAGAITAVVGVIVGIIMAIVQGVNALF